MSLYAKYLLTGSDYKVAPNFSVKEFVKEHRLSEYQFGLVSILASELQKVRDLLQEFSSNGKNVTVNITSGVRDMADYDRLVRKGYNPSRTSDHFCGLQMGSKETVGAADVTFGNCRLSTREVFGRIVQWVKEGKVKFGQVIYEKGRSEWIHLGNALDSIYSNEMVKHMSRKKFLISLDNGKTYQESEK